jgi:hypothetical protein
VAFPLFFERAVIEVEPTRTFYWLDGDSRMAPQVTVAPPADAPDMDARAA